MSLLPHLFGLLLAFTFFWTGASVCKYEGRGKPDIDNTSKKTSITCGASQCNSGAITGCDEVKCSGEDSCRTATIKATNGGLVKCMGKWSCYFSEITAKNGNVKCSGELACQGAKKITAQSISCTDTGACGSAEITGLDVVCNGESTCQFFIVDVVAKGKVGCVGDNSCLGATIGLENSNDDFDVECRGNNACLSADSTSDRITCGRSVAPSACKSVSGTVYEDLDSDEGVEEVLVRLYDSSDLKKEARTNDDGRYVIDLDDLPLGSYKVEVTPPNEVSFEQQAISETVEVNGLAVKETVDSRLVNKPEELIDRVVTKVEGLGIVSLSNHATALVNAMNKFEEDMNGFITDVGQNGQISQADTKLLSDASNVAINYVKVLLGDV